MIERKAIDEAIDASNTLFMTTARNQPYQARHNARLEQSIVILELASRDLEAQTARFGEANDRLAYHLRDESWRSRYEPLADSEKMRVARSNLQAKSVLSSIV
jgi:hypothetical protein